MHADAVVLLVGPRLWRERRRIGGLLARRGLGARFARGAREAEAALLSTAPAAIVLDATGAPGAGGDGFAAADLAAYRHPGVPVVVLGGAGCADGSLFARGPNVRAVLPHAVPLADLVEVAAWQAGPSRAAAPRARAAQVAVPA
ncbi:hypothetical protein JQC91_00250 [Jannaschia sp. Os4]|uniref:hypothetical protein n=1 Tax=Jannaschia sp. Os4 TaxID=2807617 RepID=UPI00193942A6|nr:hypothetical protein [Jannaschia sp. Os4]MBM2574720.1 hypothetical protein [Jannaschia sp. Os4]